VAALFASRISGGTAVSRYDRYVLSQYLVFFGFFSLILVAVFWINRAVVLFDRLIGDGHTAMVFLEFTALALPNLIRMVLPMAAFAAAVWVTNRLNSESELTVMQATGSSPWRLARPALAFGLITALMMSVLTHFLMPASTKQLTLREAEVARNITARLLSEGSFLHPAPGVTFYIREIDPDGTLKDVFLSDRRDPAQATIYTGARAFLVRDESRTNLIMVDGLAQRLNAQNRTLSTTVFADFSYDISELIKSNNTHTRDFRTMSTFELMTSRAGIARDEGLPLKFLTEEMHLRFARASVSIAVTLLGFSTLMLGGYSRFGVWRQIMLAFVLLIFLEVLRGVFAEPALNNPKLWPLHYVPTLIGIAISAIFLKIASRPLRILLGRRRSPVTQGGGA
jgi:lipopolysaccharide export system permease protein